MICPFCENNTGVTSRQRTTGGVTVLLILCRACKRILGVVNKK